MFAVIRTGGKQYRVAADDILDVEKVTGRAGEAVVFDEVLMVGGETPLVGAPLVDGASVAGEIVEQTRGRKIIIFKKRRRQNSRRKNGHRQFVTRIRITDILTDGMKPSPRKAAKAPATKAAKKARPETPAESVAPQKSRVRAQAPAALFEAPEGAPDDLKKISGVGPVIEGKLHALGITRYEQVANLSAEDVARVDEALSFKGRIKRDDWVGQARKLAEAKKES